MKKLKDLDLNAKKYIIFDMDGTLIDSIGIWNLTDKELIQEYGCKEVDLETVQKDREEFLRENQDVDIYLAYCKYLIDKYHFSMQNPNELIEIRWKKSGKILENDIDFKENADAFLLKLKELGFILILATMTIQVQLDIYSEKNQKMLKKMNIMEVFDYITRKEDVLYKKPHPEIYFKIMEHYGAKPEECLVFEDSYTGVLAASNAGIEVVNIYDKYSDNERLKINERTDYAIHDYKEFLDLIDIKLKEIVKTK